MRLRARLGRGVLWSLTATAAVQGSTFLGSILVARLLGQERFGQYAIVLSTLVTIATIAQLGLGSTAARHVAEYRSSDVARTGRLVGLLTVFSLVMGAAAALALLIVAPALADQVFAAPELATALRIGCLHIAFATMAGTQTGVLAGLEEFRSLAQASLAAALVTLLAVGTGAAFAGLNGAVAGLGVGAAAQFAAFLFWQRRGRERTGVRITWAGASAELQAIGGYAIPAALAGYISLPALWWGNAVLARQAGGFEELAVYHAAWSFRTLILLVPHNINRVAGSVLYQQQGIADEHGFRRVFWGNLAACAGFVILAGGITALLAPLLLGIYGAEFVAGRDVLLLLLASALLEGVGIAIYQLIQARKRMWLSTVAVALPSYGVFVLIATLLAPARGAMGLATASLASQLVMLATTALVAFSPGVNGWEWARAAVGASTATASARDA